MKPRQLEKNCQHSRGTFCLILEDLSSSRIFWTAQTSVATYKLTQCHIPEELTNSTVFICKKSLKLLPEPVVTASQPAERPSWHTNCHLAGPPPDSRDLHPLKVAQQPDPRKNPYGNWHLMGKYIHYSLCLKSDQLLCLVCSDQDCSTILTFIEVSLCSVHL